MPSSPSRTRLLALAAGAAFTLLLGAQLRPVASTPAPSTPTDNPVLERLTRREEMHAQAEYLEERALALARSVVWVPQTAATGVIWDSSGTVLSPSPPLLQSFVLTSSQGPPAKTAGSSTTATHRWLLVLARTPEGGLLWTPAMRAGSRARACHGITIPEMITNIALQSVYRGGAVFDLEGWLYGLVVDCGGPELSILPVDETERALALAASPTERIFLHNGVRLQDGDSLTVDEVRVPSPAYSAGLEPGDTLVKLDGTSLSRAQDLEPLLAASDHVLEVLRGARQFSLHLSAEPPKGDPGWIAAPAGVVLASVAAGSAAEKAGLRPGDHILRAGTRPVESPAALERIGSTRGSLDLLYLRDHSVRRAVLNP